MGVLMNDGWKLSGFDCLR